MDGWLNVILRMIQRSENFSKWDVTLMRQRWLCRMEELYTLLMISQEGFSLSLLPLFSGTMKRDSFSFINSPAVQVHGYLYPWSAIHLITHAKLPKGWGPQYLIALKISIWMSAEQFT